MAKSDGSSSTNRLSKLYRDSTVTGVAEILFLVLLGASAVVLQSTLRLPLRLPGHNGLVWISLLMVGRLISQRPWAATISSVSAATFSLFPILGFDDPFVPLTYAIPGIVIDLGFRLSGRLTVSAWIVILLGAAAHATKPLIRLIVVLGSGFPFPSLETGLVTPVAFHLLFGAAGAIAALLFLGLIRRARKPG